MPGPLVAIGSKNPAKTLGVRTVFEAFFTDCHLVEVDTRSVTRTQPMGMEQVAGGAQTRARFALSEADADFGVGVEAGLLSVSPHEHINLQVAVIVDKEGNFGIGFSSGFLIPDSFVAKMKNEGKELDRYARELTGAEKTSEEGGIVFHLTRGRMSRVQMTEQCVTMALVPWLNERTYGVQRSNT